MRAGRIATFFMTLLPVVVSAAEVRFNRDVRPILSDRCFACHGPDAGNRKSKLRLDIEADAKTDLGQGRRGIVAGNPEQSEVFKRITSANGTLRMPPSYLGHDALNSRDIETIRSWIEQGARYEAHWSFVPPQRPALPELRDSKWPRNAIDHFILNRLEREGLKPSPDAAKRTLIRRLTLDLTGLPPSPVEVEAFVRDTSADAYEKIVDRLLSSVRYAERMTIRWLEAARYADTNGYQSDGPRQMWPWRDWVVDAFHRDMPWDRFTIEQLAGDLLPDAKLSQHIATAFNRNHRTSAEGGIVDEEFRVEYVSDRVETTSSIWLGVTVGCARCHDHKFDPISQKDYYSLFAFFNNLPEKGFVWNFGNEDPVIKAPLPDQQQTLDRFDQYIAAAQQKIQQLDAETQQARRKWEERITGRSGPLEWTVTHGQQLYAGNLQFDGARVVTLNNGPKFNYRDPFTFSVQIKPDSVAGKQAILSRGEDYWEGQQHGLYVIDGKVRLHVIFRWTDLGLRVETAEALAPGSWHHIVAVYDGSMKASGVQIWVDGKPQRLNVLFDQLLWPIDNKEPWRVGAGGGVRFTGLIDGVRVYNRALAADEVAALMVSEPINEIARKPAQDRTPAEENKLRLCFLERFAPKPMRKARGLLAELNRQRQAFYATIPTVMVMKEREQTRDTFVLKRGAYDAPLEKVTPAIPAILPPLPKEGPRNRLALAQWLVDRNNPLTARATVNRFWAMVFGTGIVKTVEDLGSQGEWPVHPDLLDWLAVEFMEHGWSVKHILKTIVMSATYRQSSRTTPELVARDPENRLLARGPRFRLPPEMIRDQALAVSGLLVDKVGGPPVRPYQPPGLWQELTGGQGYKEDDGEGLWRRSLYTYWRRTVAPPAMINFDAPTRETCVIRESRTNTPLQALNLMNDVAYVEAARKLAERMILEGGANPEFRFRRGYELVLARPPEANESTALSKALAKFQTFYRDNAREAGSFLSHGKSPRSRAIDSDELAAWTAIASLILNTDEAITKE
jgi:hypothetical protein